MAVKVKLRHLMLIESFKIAQTLIPFQYTKTPGACSVLKAGGWI